MRLSYLFSLVTELIPLIASIAMIATIIKTAADSICSMLYKFGSWQILWTTVAPSEVLTILS